MRPRFACVAVLPWLAAALSACANFIAEEPAVVVDRVPGTEALRLDDLRLDGATALARVRFTCERRSYRVVHVRETPYVGSEELLEVPIGVPATVVGLAWWIVSNVVTLGAVDSDVASAPLDFGAAALNPLLNVEEGMFTERWTLRERDGSRQALDDVASEPFSALVPAAGGVVQLRFAPPVGDPGEPIEVAVGDDILLAVDLLSASPALAAAEHTRVIVAVEVFPDAGGAPLTKAFEFYVDADLARRLFEVRHDVRILADPASDPESSRAARDHLHAAGFARESARLQSSD